jgi:dihydrofolate synthase/folylpolyglutamate synthase
MNVPRGAAASELVKDLCNEKVRGSVLLFETVADALQHACHKALENDRIVAFGSFHTVAEVMRAVSAVPNLRGDA